jgi:hypothetical protein
VMFFLRSFLSGSVTAARSLTKMPSWLANPKKLLTEVTSLGTGNSAMARTFAGSGQTPDAETRNPAKVTSEPTTNLSALRVMPCFLHRWRTSSSRERSVFQSLAWTRILSTTFTTPWAPARASSVLWQNSSEELERPIGART